MRLLHGRCVLQLILVKSARGAVAVVLSVCLFVHGLWKPWKRRLTKGGTYATRGVEHTSKVGRCGPFCAPDTDPSLGNSLWRLGLM